MNQAADGGRRESTYHPAAVLHSRAHGRILQLHAPVLHPHKHEFHGVQPHIVHRSQMQGALLLVAAPARLCTPLHALISRLHTPPSTQRCYGAPSFPLRPRGVCDRSLTPLFGASCYSRQRSGSSSKAFCTAPRAEIGCSTRVLFCSTLLHRVTRGMAPLGHILSRSCPITSHQARSCKNEEYQGMWMPLGY